MDSNICSKKKLGLFFDWTGKFQKVQTEGNKKKKNKYFMRGCYEKEKYY